jgi:hypothetical protein
MKQWNRETTPAGIRERMPAGGGWRRFDGSLAENELRWRV